MPHRRRETMEKVTLLSTERIETLGEGKVIVQSTKHYRFTSDAVALSRFARVKKGDRVADFCAGSGIVGLHLLTLHGEKISALTLYEMQPALSAMAEKSIVLNGESSRVTAVCTRLQDLGEEVRGRFDLVVCNPPYFKAEQGEKKSTASAAVAKKELCITLSEIADVAAKALRFGGRFAVCYPTDRLAEVCFELRRAKIEPKRLRFLTRKEGGEPYLALIEGVYGGKVGLKIEPTEVNQCSTL